MTPLECEARSLAAAFHGAAGQRMKFGGGPYTEHLDAVAAVLIRHGRPEIEVVMAFLHDLLEDTDVAPARIEALFGAEVLGLVQALTDPKTDSPRAERKAATRARLAAAPGAAQNVKCADVIVNARDIAERDPKFAEVYLPELEALVNVLSNADPKLWAEARDTVAAGLRRLATLAG